MELSELIRTKQITSEELTGIFLRRLKRYNGALEAVVSYTDDLAYKQAKEADELLSRGVYLGNNFAPDNFITFTFLYKYLNNSFLQYLP